MRSLFLIPIFVFLAFVSSFSEKANYSHTVEKKVGVYDRDSLLDKMPNFHQKLDSFTNLVQLLNGQLLYIDTTLTFKQNEFNSDSLKWSPLVRELKRKEIVDLEQNILQFNIMAREDADNMKTKLLQPFDDSITVAAKDIGKKKKMEMVLDKKEMIGYHSANPTVKVVNVTGDMRKRLKI